MRTFMQELQTGIDEAARKVAEARLAGDDHGAEAYHERLAFLRRVARRHGVELTPHPAPGLARGAGELAGRRGRG